MSFAAVAVTAGIIALEPAFATGAAMGVALVAIGIGISFFAAEEWGLLGTATTVIGALLLAGGMRASLGPRLPTPVYGSPSRSRRTARRRSKSRSCSIRRLRNTRCRRSLLLG